MPAVGAWLASAAFTIGTTAVTWGTILKTAFVIGAAARANSQRKKARRAMLDSIQDRTIMVRSAVADCPIVYGRARVSGPFRPVGTAGSLAERFSFTVSLAGAIDAIEEVWFGDESLGTLDANGWVTAGRYVKSRQQYATKVVTSLPGSGIITLDHTPDSVASVAVNIGTDNGYASVAFSVAGNQVTISSAYAGMWVNVTYYYTVSTSLARAKGYLGQAGQTADSYLLSEFPSTWTSSHRSDGASYLACTLLYDQDVFTSGIPNVSAIVRGRRVYDPRLDSTNGGFGSHRYTDPTTWEWSRNPALIARDYLKTELGCDDSEIDDTTVIAAANACDEPVEVNPAMTTGDYWEYLGVKYQNRYTFDGALSSQADRLSNLESILMAMVGSAVYSAGKWELQAGVWEAPTTLALDDDDLAGGQVVVQARQARRDLINGVRGNYMHPDKWVVDDFPPYTSNTFVTEDGGAVSIRKIDLPMIRCPYRAQRVAKLMMFQSRQALTMTATWNLGAYEITPTKMVDLTIERYGWAGKDFKCMNRVYDPMGGVELSFKEEASAIYEWDYNEAIDPDPAPNTTLPDPRDVPAITGIAVSSGSTVYQRLSDGTVRPLAVVTWDAVTDIGVTNGGYIEFIWKRGIDTNWTVSRLSGSETRFQIPTAANELLNIGVRAVSGALVTGPWSFAAHSVSADAISNAGDTVRGAGVNLLPNAGLRYSIWPYTNGHPVGYTGTLSHVTPGSNGATRDNGAVSLIYTGAVDLMAFTGAIVVVSPTAGAAATVSAGDRVEAQAEVAMYRGEAHLYVRFENSNGVFISELPVTGGVSSCAEDGRAWDAELSSKTHLWGFVTAPAGAARATVEILTKRTTDVNATHVYLNLPYIGLAHPSQTLPSPWVEGPNAVSTDLIGDEAATEVYSAQESASPGNSGAALDYASITYTNDTSAAVKAVVTVSIDAAITDGSVDEPSTANLAIGSSGTWGTTPSVTSVRFLSVGSGGTVRGSASLVGYGVINPGETVTVTSRLVRANRSNTSPTEYATTVIHDARARLEIVKK